MAETVLEGMLSLDAGDKVVMLPGVHEVMATMQHFQWPDCAAFVLMLSICTAVGLFFGMHRHQNTQDYLMGGRRMHTIPVAASLTASFISGISLLGIPTEIYLFGTQYAFILIGIVLMAVIFNNIYLPVIYNLNLTSTYEYHERRFNKKVRVFASFLYTIEIICYLPIVIYVPALAFNQVTGINVHLITPIICVICTFYTALGGLKAVVWTDVIQTGIMFGAMLLLIIKGTLDFDGGFNKILQINMDTERIEPPNFDPNIFSRHTIWSLAIGSSFFFVQQGTMSQMMIQRYLSLPTIESAKRASWYYVFGMFCIVLVCGYCGLLMFATFHKCDPLTTMLAREKDQLVPLLVMEILGNWPGLIGIFIAGIVSASLSSLSSGLNSMAIVVLEDFYKLGFNKIPTENEESIITKLSVVILGAISLGLVFIVEKLGTVLQLTMSVGTIASGPSLALFTMGVLIPWVNWKGALTGAGTALVLVGWLALRAQYALVAGHLQFAGKPVNTEGCRYQFTPIANDHFNATDPHVGQNEIFLLYRLSYLWYTLTGVLVAVTVGAAVSVVTGPVDPRDVDPALLTPFVRRLIKPRHYPNEPTDEIIYAYDDSKNESKDLNKKIYIPLKIENNLPDNKTV